MPAPIAATYSLGVRVTAHTAFRDALDAGAGPAIVRVRSAADVLLGTVTLTDPCGTVSGSTGILTFSMAGTGSASATGTAAYAEFCTSAGAVELALPAQQGTTAVSGRFVMNSLSLVSGNPIEILAASVG